MRIFFIFIFSLLTVWQAAGKHIVGGEATYKIIHTDGYVGGMMRLKVKFIIYRDAKGGGADFDNPAFFGVFIKDNTAWKFVQRIDKNIENRSYIKTVHDPCVVSPPNILYEKGEYNFTLELPISESSYKITYQRCCRTNFIINILSPEATGATYYVDISPEAQLYGNTSPVFKGFPPSVLCANSYFEYDHSCTDADGDSLAYEFFHPYHGGGLAGSSSSTGGNANDCNGVKPDPTICPPPYPHVIFKAPYTYDNPMGGNPRVRINNTTGLIYGTPVNQGQFVVGVKVKEYRNGTLIGSVQRDFQFNVTSCAPLIQAIIQNANQLDVRKFDILSCGEDTVTFINKSIDRDKIFNYRWLFNIKGDIVEIGDWDATVVFPDTGVYTGRLLLNENSPCNDSADLVIRIYPGIDAAFEYQYDSCYDKEVNFLNFSHSDGGDITKNIWQFGDDSTSAEVSPVHAYEKPGDYNVSLVVEDVNTCRDTANAMIKFYPLPDRFAILPSRYLGCAPVSIRFHNSTNPFQEEYKILWHFGDGSTDTVYSPMHLYEEPGFYTVYVKIINPLGCTLESEYNQWIEIKKSPVADFTYVPRNPNIINPTVNFHNLSQDAEVFQWDFGNGDYSFEFEPGYTYPDTGRYWVTLIATSKNHCDDTIQKALFVSPDVILHFPNAFTPNADGLNDEFKPVGSLYEYVRAYNLTVWDRWGGKVFETDDINQAWFGSKFNQGPVLPQGVYVYQYYYMTPTGKEYRGRGSVTLLNK